jgi:hypothetical protein
MVEVANRLEEGGLQGTIPVDEGANQFAGGFLGVLESNPGVWLHPYNPKHKYVDPLELALSLLPGNWDHG